MRLYQRDLHIGITSNLFDQDLSEQYQTDKHQSDQNNHKYITSNIKVL